MSKREKPLFTEKVYHVFTRSIAKFKVFRTPDEYKRIIERLSFYSLSDPTISFSYFSSRKIKDTIMQNRSQSSRRLVKIIAYCIMPTHVHLILKQLEDNGISTFMCRVFNSYSKYFNLKTNRKGPVWEGRFRNVEVETDEQLLHLTRYLHLNPSTSFLTKKPEDWPYSSYLEFLGKTNKENRICEFLDILDIKPKNYKKFVDLQINYQRQLKCIKDLLVD